MVMSQQLGYGTADLHQAMVSDFRKAHFVSMEPRMRMFQEGEASLSHWEAFVLSRRCRFFFHPPCIGDGMRIRGCTYLLYDYYCQGIQPPVTSISGSLRRLSIIDYVSCRMEMGNKPLTQDREPQSSLHKE
jgi:hypothetical protein